MLFRKGDPTVRLITKILREEEAATAVEYAVMLALVLLVTFGAIGLVGAQAGGLWGGIESDLRDVGFFGPTEGS